MRSYSGAELCILLLYALPGETPLRESLFRRLSRAYDVLGAQESRDGELHRDELLRLGCTAEEADAVLARLSQRNVLGQYLMKLGMQGIEVITRISPEYPQRLRDVLGLHAPLVLFCAGSMELWQKTCISLVGSRRLRQPGSLFARQAGRAIGAQGYCYCSGGASGADSIGFSGAMESGGSAVVFLADSLKRHLTDRRYEVPLAEGRLLLVSEHGPDLEFTTPRAMSRNRLIHAMGEKVLVAQSDYGSGGTWSGTMENIKAGWSPVFMFSGEPEDPGTRGLMERGAAPVSMDELKQLDTLGEMQISLFDGS